MSQLNTTPNSTAIPIAGTIILPQDEYEAFINHIGEFDVICYEVKAKDNKILSPLLETKEQAVKLRGELKKDHPGAKIGKLVWYYSSINERGRLEMIDSIVKSEISTDKAQKSPS